MDRVQLMSLTRKMGNFAGKYYGDESKVSMEARIARTVARMEALRRSNHIIPIFLCFQI